MFKTQRIGIRLEPEIRQKLEQLIEQRKFKNISDAVRQIIKQFLKESEDND